MFGNTNYVTVSAQDIMNSNEFRTYLEAYNWHTQAQVTPSGFFFYNGSNNVALVIEQKSGFVEISVRNAMSAMGDVIANKNISSLPEALGFISRQVAEHADTNIFEDTNFMG